jgi:hypothetical protein
MAEPKPELTSTVTEFTVTQNDPRNRDLYMVIAIKGGVRVAVSAEKPDVRVGDVLSIDEVEAFVNASPNTTVDCTR